MRVRFSGVLAAAGLLVLQRQGARRYARAIARIEAVKGVRTGAGTLSLRDDPGRRLEQLTHSLVQDLEDSYFRLIKTNIQLLSLKEVGVDVVNSDTSTVRAVRDGIAVTRDIVRIRRIASRGGYPELAAEALPSGAGGGDAR